MAEPLVQGVAGVAGAAAAEESALAYFAALRRAFEAAGERGGVLEHELTVGRSPLRLRFAGPALVPAILPALGHLAAPAAGRPATTICIWDSESTGVQAPAFPWRRSDVRQREEVHGFNGARVRTQHNPETLVLTMFDAHERTVVWWAPSPADVPWYDRAAPLRTALHWSLTAPTRHLLHAGAVAGPGGALLLVGKGGSGKSTTAVLCLEDGFDYLGDDYVLLTLDGIPEVHSLYRTAKLTPETVGLVPGLAGGDAVIAAAEKVVLDVAVRRPERLRTTAPVTAVVVPTLTARPTSRLHRIPASTALRALAPSTVLQLPHLAPAALGTMAELVRAVPTYALEVGREGPPPPVLLRRLVG